MRKFHKTIITEKQLQKTYGGKHFQQENRRLDKWYSTTSIYQFRGIK